MDVNLDHLQHLTAPRLMQWVARTYGDRAGLSCSFGGAGGMVLAHMAARCTPRIPILFLDTDFLFDETYTLMQRVRDEWGLDIRIAKPRLSPEEQAQAYGAALWSRNPNMCCHLRKVEPMQGLLADIDCWVTGLRRDQSSTRRHIQPIERHTLESGRQILKVNPLASWSRKEVWEYIQRHKIPYNPLLDQGYGSLGCVQCTAPSAGADERAGRWQGTGKVECGLHTFTARREGPADSGR